MPQARGNGNIARLPVPADASMPISRRAFTTSALLAAAALPAGANGIAMASGTPRAQGTPVFQHGLASGDPLADRVILWTRVTPARLDRAVPVRWRIATDAALRDIVDQGEVNALPQRDFTVKVDALGLAPGRTYYYGFDADGEATPVGRTRTLPVGALPRLRLAVASCANLPFGWFNVYANIAARADLDAVLHLGDYLYEYGPGEYGDGREFGRVHVPAREILDLADYRTRHAQYKRDTDLQAAHRQHPWIVAWDDHESANNAWSGGAGNHDAAREGPWPARRAAAVRAFAEWMPIRELPDDDTGLRTWRSFAFGDLVDLAMLDTRLHGRNLQAKRDDAATIADPARTLLGMDQEAWLARQLRRSQERGAAFRLLGQQVLFGQMLGDERNVLNTDGWDGYPAARQRVFDQLARERIGDVVVLTGDLHSAWALDLTPAPFGGYDAATGRGALAVEMVTSAVTSPSPFRDAEAASAAEVRMLRNGPHLKYLNYRQRGYLLLDVTPERAQGEWYFVADITRRGSADLLGAAYATARGSNHLLPMAAPSAANPERPPLVG
jgi:alkaline phosphatase D